MRNQSRCLFVVLTMLALCAPVEATPPGPAGTETFTWFGELVSAEPAAQAMTVKVRVAYQDALSELKKFKPGDPVWVHWSGSSDYSDAVRQFRSAEADRAIPERLMMPAQLVSPAPTHEYVTLRVKVPEAAIAAITHLRPGEWVTVTSRQQPATEADAVLAVRPYSQGAEQGD